LSAPLVFSADEARAVVRRALADAGASGEDAGLCADALVESSLRGIDSHGFVALLPTFARQFREDVSRSAVEPVAEHGAVARLDGHGVFGLRAARDALQKAIELAGRFGVGAVGLSRVGYLGALWWCVESAAERGLIGLAATNSMACVAPFGGREPLHGTNPIAAAIPCEPDPILLDMRTNVFRMADFWESLRTGGPLPEGGLIHPDGTPLTDPAQIDEAVYLPLAGPKGYGLALLVDVLTAALADGPIGREVSLDTELGGLCAFFLVFDPAFFGSRERFLDAVVRLAEQARATQPLDPRSPVRLPGERSYRERQRRLEHGIPVDRAHWRHLTEALEELGISVADTPGSALR
jgi:ureidoglycolate dehydrogenase (NAD+)